MDINNNHLINSDMFEEMPEDQKLNYQQIPDQLEYAAKQKLKGRNSAYVSKTSGGKLSKWAAKQRKEKRKAQRAARKAKR